MGEAVTACQLLKVIAIFVMAELQELPPAVLSKETCQAGHIYWCALKHGPTSGGTELRCFVPLANKIDI